PRRGERYRRRSTWRGLKSPFVKDVTRKPKCKPVMQREGYLPTTPSTRALSIVLPKAHSLATEPEMPFDCTKKLLVQQRRRLIDDKPFGDSSLLTPNWGNAMRHSRRLCSSNTLNRRLRRTSYAKLRHT